ncbi:hypothetical protein D3C76_1351990 [compost metagenome]
MKSRQSRQKLPPGESSSTTGTSGLLPVWIRVSTSSASSRVPKPPGHSTRASASLTKNSLRMKKKWNGSSLSVPSTVGLACCSKGRVMLNPRLWSLPAPSWAAAMMPPPAPVMTIRSERARVAPSSRARAYIGCSSGVRAEPNTVTLRRPL